MTLATSGSPFLGRFAARKPKIGKKMQLFENILKVAAKNPVLRGETPNVPLPA
jgi:hypothetical protein